jgi:hypothetical protein
VLPLATLRLQHWSGQLAAHWQACSGMARLCHKQCSLRLHVHVGACHGVLGTPTTSSGRWGGTLSRFHGVPPACRARIVDMCEHTGACKCTGSGRLHVYILWRIDRTYCSCLCTVPAEWKRGNGRYSTAQSMSEQQSACGAQMLTLGWPFPGQV